MPYLAHASRKNPRTPPAARSSIPARQLRLGCAAVWYGSDTALATARSQASFIPDNGDGSTLHDAIWFQEVITDGFRDRTARRLKRMKQEQKATVLRLNPAEIERAAERRL